MPDHPTPYRTDLINAAVCSGLVKPSIGSQFDPAGWRLGLRGGALHDP